ncbi:hypothetical protein C8R44DRAFT_750359 [Mycena epipterygia]|nr:hypothetical protein C8R44DRAFT_750359 [Mycena epipterygia]
MAANAKCRLRANVDISVALSSRAVLSATRLSIFFPPAGTFSVSTRARPNLQKHRKQAHLARQEWSWNSESNAALRRKRRVRRRKSKNICAFAEDVTVSGSESNKVLADAAAPSGTPAADKTEIWTWRLDPAPWSLTAGITFITTYRTWLNVVPVGAKGSSEGDCVSRVGRGESPPSELGIARQISNGRGNRSVKAVRTLKEMREYTDWLEGEAVEMIVLSTNFTSLSSNSPPSTPSTSDPSPVVKQFAMKLASSSLDNNAPHAACCQLYPKFITESNIISTQMFGFRPSALNVPSSAVLNGDLNTHRWVKVMGDVVIPPKRKVVHSITLLWQRMGE